MKTKSEKIQDLSNAYKEYREIGFFLGAGVSIGSNFPSYMDLVLEIVSKINEKKVVDDSNKKAISYLLDLYNELKKKKHDSKNIKEKDEKTNTAITTNKEPESSISIDPEEIALFADCIYKSEGINKTVNEAVINMIYEILDDSKGKIVDTLKKNNTLNSIINFCIEYPPNEVIKYPQNKDGKKISVELSKEEIIKAGKYLTGLNLNPKVGCILTTNYDPVLEVSCHKKFYQQRGLFKPVGLPYSREYRKKGNRTPIPVYHLHGYVHFTNTKKYPTNLIVTEEDYFKSSYEPLGFCNYIAMSALRKYPFIFIGSGMRDKNIRRFLYHLRIENEYLRTKNDKNTPLLHYAIMETPKEPGSQEYQEAILTGSFNVVPIWINSFDEIKDILKQVYTNGNKKKEQEWDLLYDYRYKKS